jgi:hypothetical protein
MKTKKTNILLSIIAINLTLLTLIQLDLVPQKAFANSSINPTNSNYGLVPLNENGKIEIELSSEQLESIKSSMNDDDYIIERILYCIDGSTIVDGEISTYCNN